MNDPNDGTWTYAYDCGGNILNKKQYAYTTGTPGTVQQIVSYAYGDADWKDKLTRFNGVDIACDAIGNPIQDGVWTYTWENGRQLRRMACDATIAEFVYNADGLRVQKTVNGVTTNYTLHGKNIVHMTKGNAELHFWYDAQNRPAIVEFNGTKYGYLYNLQGDVIGLIDSANTEVVRYTYDAWGKLLSVTGSLANTIGYYNPFRYRGYVYDVETGLYYLRSRYYNPSWGRFVNADKLIENNLYTYCCNQPISRIDPIGLDSLTLTRNKVDSSAKYPEEMLPVDSFVELVIQAVTNKKWKYIYGHSEWLVTDCVGLPKYILNWYYSYRDFEEFSQITKGHNKGEIYNQVIDLVAYGIQYGDTWEIENPEEIPIGAAVFQYDLSHERANSTNKGWIHVGIYIGSWGDYEYAVAQAASEQDGVGIWPLSKKFTRYGLFSGVDYR